MIDIQELRLGCLIYVKPTPTRKTAVLMQVTAISADGTLDARNHSRSCSKISIEDVFPAEIDNGLRKKMIQHEILNAINGKDIFFYFPGRTRTYFLVYDKAEKNYYIGMADADEPENPRRVTRPFIEFHKLQNAYRTIYDQEMKNLNV